MTNVTPCPSIRNTTRRLLRDLRFYAEIEFPVARELKAWDLFWNDSGEPYQEDHPMMLIFKPWYLFTYQTIQTNPIAYDYLMDHVSSLNKIEFEYLKSNLETQFSFYEVKERISECSLILNNLLDEEEIIVFEGSRPEEVKVRDILYLKTVSVGGVNFIESCGQKTIASGYRDQIAQLAKMTRKKSNEVYRFDLFKHLVHLIDQADQSKRYTLPFRHDR